MQEHDNKQYKRIMQMQDPSSAILFFCPLTTTIQTNILHPRASDEKEGTQNFKEANIIQ